MSLNSRQPTQEELALSCFHHEQKKDCKIAHFGSKFEVLPEEPNELSDRTDEELKTKGKPPSKVKCVTHKVIAWSCGWEIGIHGGELSQGYNHNAFDESNPIESLP